MPSCRLAVVDEIYQNYELGEMLSFKKAQKIRIKGSEILLHYLVGMLKLRNGKPGGFNEIENQIFIKFFN